MTLDDPSPKSTGTDQDCSPEITGAEEPGKMLSEVGTACDEEENF